MSGDVQMRREMETIDEQRRAELQQALADSQQHTASNKRVHQPPVMWHWTNIHLISCSDVVNQQISQNWEHVNADVDTLNYLTKAV